MCRLRRFRHYPRPVCPTACRATITWELSTGRGTVYTWTIVRGPTLPAFEHKLPYNVVDVLMDEGVHFVSEVLDCAAGRDHGRHAGARRPSFR